MSIVLFDPKDRAGLFPFTYTRAVADLRLGIFTRKEWWRLLSGQKGFVLTEPYLQPLYPDIPAGAHLFVDASLLPDEDLLRRILLLPEGRALEDDSGQIVAVHTTADMFETFHQQKDYTQRRTKVAALRTIRHSWQLFQWNDEWLRKDFEKITRNRRSERISRSNQTIQPENIFMEKGAVVECAILNASAGPIYIGKKAVVMEGACLRGPIAVGEGAVVKMGAKVYGGTSVGPYSTIGGEVKNAVLMGYSNKAHDGYLGDAAIGYWCNIGGGTTNSNVKNTAGEVEMCDMVSGHKIKAGSKAGMVMGDYTRVAINSSINTGSVYGVCSNVFGSGLLPKLVPNFSWGTDAKNKKYELEKAIQDVNRWMHLKHHRLSEAEKNILTYIFDHHS